MSWAPRTAAGCRKSPTGPTYRPQIPTNWVSGVSNPNFRLIPGTKTEFSLQTPEGLETITVDVLAGTTLVNGVAAVTLHDRVFLAGSLIEDTIDWYAQDGAGNVWYLGEDAKEYKNGQVVGTGGTWKWGVNGGLPGIIMWGDPAAHIGEEYRQEYAAGVAEDFAKVVALGQSVTVPYRSFTGCVQTEEWNGLKPTDRDYKYYCAPAGFVLGVPVAGGPRLELLRVTAP